MTQVSAAEVKALRELTGCGMLDCKKALQENGGDTSAAVDWLRKKGLASAGKKSGRTAAEGLVALSVKENAGAIIELNAETDFVARNEQFQALVAEVAAQALTHGSDVSTLQRATLSSGKTVEEGITQAVATIGENMTLRRTQRLEVSQGMVVPYVHNAVVDKMGKIGVLVALESAAPVQVLEPLGKQIAMHVAAAAPASLSKEDLDPALIERERTVLKEQAMASGKPAEIAEKMVEGRLRKYYEEVVLLEQAFVMDGKTKVADVVAEAAKQAGTPIALKAFARFQLGEGVEKKAEDFAAEVAAVTGAVA